MQILYSILVLNNILFFKHVQGLFLNMITSAVFNLVAYSVVISVRKLVSEPDVVFVICRLKYVFRLWNWLAKNF